MKGPIRNLIFVVSAIAPIFSLLIWMVIDRDLYITCAYGPEYCYFDSDLAQLTLLLLAVGIPGTGFILSIGYLIKFREKLSFIFVVLNLMVSPLMFNEIWHTAATTRYAVLEKKD